MFTYSKTLAGLLIALALSLPRPCSAQGFHVTKLILPGASESLMQDLNDQGMVVGTATFAATRTAAAYTRSFIFVPSVPNGTSGPLIDLGTFCPSLASRGTFVEEINNKGQIVGTAETCAVRPIDNAIVRNAFLITPEDTNGDGRPDTWFRDTDGDGINDLMKNLTSQFAASPSASAVGWEVNKASAINDKGQIGGMGFSNNGQVYHPFLWDRDELGNLLPPVKLGTFGGNGQPYAINEEGVLVGAAHTSDNKPHVALWRKTGDGNYSLTDLGTLGGSQGYAWDLNNLGQVTGVSYLSSYPRNSFSYYHAFLWTDANANGVRDGSEMVDLGNVPNGTGDVLGLGINDFGQLAVRGQTKSGPRAFLWQRGANGSGVYTDLNNLKASGETGLILFLARDLNNAPRPQIIARGYYKSGGSDIGALLTPR